jgi:RNA polymerase sigma-70 factor (ECF subfamily)
VDGDKEAFAELVRRHEHRVYNLALRMTGRPEDARDAAQEAFLSAYRKLGSFRGDARFGTWIHRITLNACYDFLRKRRRGPFLDRLADHDLEGPPVPDHADASIGSIDVERALAALPEDHRAVLVLHDVQDLAYEEVAEILGVPVGTVKSRLHRARVALARELGPGPGPGVVGPEGTERDGPAGPSEGTVRS